MENVAYHEGSLGQSNALDPWMADYRLIARRSDGRTHVLLVEPTDGERLLPVFSAEAEAQMFVWLGGIGSVLDDAWYPRRTQSGELLAMLIGPRRSVDRVALDPSPKIMTAGGEYEIEMICSSRKDFVERLLSARAQTYRLSDDH